MKYLPLQLKPFFLLKPGSGSYYRVINTSCITMTIIIIIIIIIIIWRVDIAFPS